MLRRIDIACLTALLAFASAGPAAAPAAHRVGEAIAPWQLARGGTSLDAAVARIQRQTGGRILSAKTVRHNGRAVHHIKVLLPSGKVRVFQVDAGG